jgi:hypothetical protein
MHCECEAYVLQKRMLNLQFTGFGKRREHKLRGDILGQRPHGRILGHGGLQLRPPLDIDILRQTDPIQQCRGSTWRRCRREHRSR